jgi:hypothetical protein
MSTLLDRTPAPPAPPPAAPPGPTGEDAARRLRQWAADTIEPALAYACPLAPADCPRPASGEPAAPWLSAALDLRDSYGDAAALVELLKARRKAVHEAVDKAFSRAETVAHEWGHFLSQFLAAGISPAAGWLRTADVPADARAYTLFRLPDSYLAFEMLGVMPTALPPGSPVAVALAGVAPVPCGDGLIGPVWYLGVVAQRRPPEVFRVSDALEWTAAARQGVAAVHELYRERSKRKGAVR